MKLSLDTGSKIKYSEEKIDLIPFMEKHIAILSKFINVDTLELKLDNTIEMDLFQDFLLDFIKLDTDEVNDCTVKRVKDWYDTLKYANRQDWKTFMDECFLNNSSDSVSFALMKIFEIYCYLVFILTNRPVQPQICLITNIKLVLLKINYLSSINELGGGDLMV